MVDMINELDGKVAIVTGSARTSAARAEELARAGAAVVINSVQAKDLCEEVVEGIRAAGGKAIPFMADVRDPDAVTAMAAAATKDFGGIDILVHNAAVRNNTSFEDMDLETFSTTVDISIYGMFHLAKAVLPSMKERGGGAIIGVTRHAELQHVAYHGRQMGRNAHLRLGARSAPYNWANRLWSELRYGPGEQLRRRQQPLGSKADIPLGRMGMPQDMADLSASSSARCQLHHRPDDTLQRRRVPEFVTRTLQQAQVRRWSNGLMLSLP